MSDRTSKTILEGDKILQERRKEEGKNITPYNYDTNVDKDLAVARAESASIESILDNNQTLVKGGLEANSTQKETEPNSTPKTPQPVEVTNLNTSAIPSKQFSKSSRGDNNDKTKDER